MATHGGRYFVHSPAGGDGGRDPTAGKNPIGEGREQVFPGAGEVEDRGRGEPLCRSARQLATPQGDPRSSLHTPNGCAPGLGTGAELADLSANPRRSSTRCPGRGQSLAHI